MSTIVKRKLDRLREGGQPRVLDLFAGCGGIAVGFQRAGCISLGGVELDELASRSYATNFHGNLPPKLFDVHAAPKDIAALDPEELVARFGHSAEEVDLIVGGPPCPTFTRVGRAKLREVQKHPEAFLHDPRAELYLHYLEFVEALSPVALLMENVPDLLNFGGRNVAEDVCDALERMGYVCAYTLLNAANYGVPQMRERFFLVAMREEVGRSVKFPIPLCLVHFPPGYEGSRDVALRGIRDSQNSLFATPPRYVPPPVPREDAARPVTVRQAIADLPPITSHLNGGMPRGARRFDRPVPYRNVRPSWYAQEMREWPGFAANGLLYDHVTRSLTDRDFRLFRDMRHGDDYPKAHALAVRLFEATVAARRASGVFLADGSPEYERLRSSYVPPYDAGKFPNKWRKMDPDEPARTLMAHLGKDAYSHIHYDSTQARVISVREAARLQSFPDGFKFCGTMNPAFRQIGNAVPPLMAYALAWDILSQIKE